MTVATLTFKRIAKLSLSIFKLILFYEYMIDMKNKSIPYTWTIMSYVYYFIIMYYNKYLQRAPRER